MFHPLICFIFICLQGEYQWIRCQFLNPTQLTDLAIQFQGGFSSKKIVLQFFDTPQNLLSEITIYPEDNNLIQTFAHICQPNPAKAVKILLLDCSDMFGRVIIYKLDLFCSSQ